MKNRFIEFAELPEKQLFPGIRARISHSDQLTLTHVTLDEGAVLPEHHHINEQWTTILEGELELIVGGEKKILKPGMCAYIPSDVPHFASAITRCVVVDVFVPKRDDL